MEYIKFGIASKPKNKFREENNVKTEVIKKEYPKYFEKAPTTHPNFKRDLIQPEDTPTENKAQKSDGTKILCTILALILMFTGIYLSEIKAPEYIEALFINSIKAHTEEPVKQETQNKTKIIGEKYFIENKESTSNTEENRKLENSSFAEKVKNSSNQSQNSGENTEIQVISEIVSPQKEKITAKNMSYGSDKIYLTNRTDLNIDPEYYLNSSYPIEKIKQGTENPKVLIIHTHGTESYSDTGENGKTRSSDTDKNIVRVGKELSEILNYYGIPTIHSKTMHDEISYVKSYDSSKQEVKQYLENYPTIEYVIDIHRDALGTEEEPVKTYTTVNGDPTAQLMFVMGTNASGGDHPNYEKNLTAAIHIQNTANKIFPGLMRPVNIRPVIFNQNLTTGYMLLEVGSDANTLGEALTSIRMFARAFAQTVL